MNEDSKWDLHSDQTEISLWERLGKAAMLDIETSSFSWDKLSSLHHTEHGSSNELSEDEMNKALEVHPFLYSLCTTFHVLLFLFDENLSMLRSK